ncbi:MAG: phosphotransferase [Candidatus Levybacteria bacterium]|nr:phosphotransferase [Candidatus Levybacteria bacterium]
MGRSKQKISLSDKYLPQEWVDQKPNIKVYLPALDVVCTNMQMVGQLSGGASTATFVLNDSGNLRVCQFGPPLIADKKIDRFEEKYNPKKFEHALERLRYLSDNGVAVPKILSYGEVDVTGNNREYIVMDLVEGIGVNVFIGHNPSRRQEVYSKLGEALAGLSTVPYCEKQGSANRHVLDKVRHAGDFLARKQIISSTQLERLMSVLNRKLFILGDRPMSYVHLDPFPTNFLIRSGNKNLNITLMDVEAIRGGHQLVEGLGRAVQWGIYDWEYISKTRGKATNSTIEAFLNGYSKICPEVLKFLRSNSELSRLLEISQLASIPQTIMHEMKENASRFRFDKIELKNTFEWKKNMLLRLIAK